MEWVLLFLILILLAAFAGGGLYVWRALAKGGLPTRALGQSASLDPLRSTLEARYEAEVERLRAEAQRVIGDVEGELGRFRETLRTSAEEQESRISQLRKRYDEADDKTTTAVEQTLREIRAHHDAELGRLREAVGAAMAAIAARQRSPDAIRLATRRAEAIGDLYRQLSGLESAFVSIVNPVLLPGETIAIPADLPAETLRLESWKEIGDTTYAFARAFAQHRLDLDDATARDLTDFVAEVRGLLTRAIYPNLQTAAANPEARQSLRKGLDQLATVIARTREGLEGSYRDQHA